MADSYYPVAAEACSDEATTGRTGPAIHPWQPREVSQTNVSLGIRDITYAITMFTACVSTVAPKAPSV